MTVCRSEIRQWNELVQKLGCLAAELRRSSKAGHATVWAAGEALECAQTLLRAYGMDTDRIATATLLREAVALARSTVEGAKYAAREGVNYTQSTHNKN